MQDTWELQQGNLQEGEGLDSPLEGEGLDSPLEGGGLGSRR